MNLEQQQVVDIAQDLLSRRFGGQQKLSEVERLSGSGHAIVLRARVSSSPFLQQRTVVLKHNPPTGQAIDDVAFISEVVAYQFTTSLSEDTRPGPVLLAHDIEQRILVLTDLGDSNTLSDTLAQANDDERMQIIRALGTELGQMHADTAGREPDFEALLNRVVRNHPDKVNYQLRADALHNSIYLGVEILERAGLNPPEAVTHYAHASAATLLSGNERAFTPFDLSPDNIIVSHKISFLDYEWAGFRNVGFDVACVIAGFPQFLFARPISNDEADVFVHAWAREVTDTWPRFGESEELNRLIVRSLIGWALSSVATMYTGGVEELASFASEKREIEEETANSLLRPSDFDPFSEDELLVRRDLYETFEALHRFAARRGRGSYAEEYQVIADFGQQVADRLREKRLGSNHQI